MVLLSLSVKNMQTRKEIVNAAIDFQKPDRLPLMFDVFGISDVHEVNWNQIGTGDHSSKFSYDEWGCGWSRTEANNMGQVTEHPLLEWNNLVHYKWPNPDDKSFYEGMENEFDGCGDKYISTSIFMLLFERMHSLRGFENTLVDLYMEREKVEMLADCIVDYNICIIQRISSMFPGQIQGFSFTDDWGTELSLFINPKLWREFFKPRYKRIFDACKEAGWHVWMHSCGKVNDILGDLLEIGLNVINLQQPTILGIEEIGKKYAGKLCFQSLCDIQNTLPFKNDDEIRKEAKLLLDCWSTENGGFIFSDYGDGEAIGVPIEKKKVMFDVFLKHQRWNCL